MLYSSTCLVCASLLFVHEKVVVSWCRFNSRRHHVFPRQAGFLWLVQISLCLVTKLGYVHVLLFFGSPVAHVSKATAAGSRSTLSEKNNASLVELDHGSAGTV